MNIGEKVAKGVTSKLRYVWASVLNKVGMTNTLAVLRVAEAYKRLFYGQGASREDAELVLCDLAVVTKAYKVLMPSSEVTEYSLGFDNGMKYVFEHIVNAVEISPEQMEALRQMAEAERNNQRGGYNP